MAAKKAASRSRAASVDTSRGALTPTEAGPAAPKRGAAKGGGAPSKGTVAKRAPAKKKPAAKPTAKKGASNKATWDATSKRPGRHPATGSGRATPAKKGKTQKTDAKARR